MWIRDYKYEDITFHAFADWFGLDGLKFCLSIGDPQTRAAINLRPQTIIKAIQFFTEHAEEIMLVGWAGDEVFWYDLEHNNDLDDQERITKIIINSKFSDHIDRTRAHKHLEFVTEQKRLKITTRTKQKHSMARRSQFAKDYDRLMLALIERDGYQCAECGTVEDLTIDHIVPLSKGGTDELNNLQLLCRQHNSAKGDVLPSKD